MTMRCLAIFAFACGVLVWPERLDFSDAPRWQLLSIGLPCICLMLGVRLRGSVWLVLAYAVMSLLWSLLLWDALNGLWQLVLFCLALSLGARADTARPIMLGASYALSFNSAIAVWLALNIWRPDIFGHAGALIAQQPFGFILQPPQLPNQVGALFYNKNFLAEAAALTLCWCALERHWMLVACIAPAFVLTASHGAALALLMGALALYLPRMRLLVALGGLAALAALVAPTSADVRFALWESALVGWWAKPWGHGIGQFYGLLPVFMQDTLAARHEHPHNEMIEWLFELGLVGCIWLGLLFWRALAATQARPLVATVLVLALVGFPLHAPFALLLCGVILGDALRERNSLRGAFMESSAALEWSASDKRRLLGSGRWQNVSAAP